jgi:hypothetical protein
MSITSSNGTEAGVSSIEKEAVRTEIAKTFQTDDTLFARLKKDAKSMPIAYSIPGNSGERGAWRVPMAVQGNGNITQISGNFDDMGTGNMTQYTAQFLSGVTFVLGTQISYLTAAATDSKTKALIDTRSQEFANSLDYLKTGLSAQLEGSGAGDIDLLPATQTLTTGGSGAQVSSISGWANPNRFQDGQTVQFFTAIGGSFVQAGQISFVDAVNNVIYFYTNLTSLSTATAYAVMVNASSSSLVGAAGSSLAGLPAYLNSSTSGTLNGVNKANYPGRLSTPTVNLDGDLITVGQARLGLQKLRIALGSDTPAVNDLFWYSSYAQEAAIENLNLKVSIVNRQDVKGERGPDMGYKNAPDTFMQHDLLISGTADSETIYGIVPKYFAFGITKEVDLYEVKGQVVFPLYGASGGLASGEIFYYIWTGNLCCANPRAGVVFSDCGKPTGY